MKKLSTLLIAGVIAAGVLTMPSSAVASSGEPEQVRVAYADLNLASAAGKETFQRRLKQAARQVCGTPGLNLREQRQASACQKDTLTAALARVEVVTAGRTGGDIAIAAMQ